MREAAQSYHHLALTIALLLLLGAIAGSDHDCIVVRLSSHGNEMWNAIHYAGMEAAAECGATQMKRLLPKRRTQIEQDQRCLLRSAEHRRKSQLCSTSPNRIMLRVHRSLIPIGPRTSWTQQKSNRF